jgi:hypothetical protein
MSTRGHSNYQVNEIVNSNSYDWTEEEVLCRSLFVLTDNTITKRKRTKGQPMIKRKRTVNTMVKRNRPANTMAKRNRTANTMAKRNRTANTMEKRNRTANTMAKRTKKRSRQTIVNKILRIQHRFYAAQKIFFFQELLHSYMT